MSKVFEHRFTVTMGDTNLEKNVYWANYFDWFGHARELFLLELMQLPVGVLAHEVLEAQNVVIKTVQTEMKHMNSAFLGTRVGVRITTRDFRPCSVTLCCEVVNLAEENPKKAILAVGSQKVAFENFQGKFIRIPELLRERAEEYQADLTPAVATISLGAAESSPLTNIKGNNGDSKPSEGKKKPKRFWLPMA